MLNVTSLFALGYINVCLSISELVVLRAVTTHARARYQRDNSCLRHHYFDGICYSLNLTMRACIEI